MIDGVNFVRYAFPGKPSCLPLILTCNYFFNLKI